MSAPASSPPDESFWDSIREGLRGSHRDFTEGSIRRAILVLAIPMVLEMVMESVFAVCDVFFVSKLGASAVATVGLTESWVVLIYAAAMGLAIAASATVARRTGERDHEGAAIAATQAMVLSLSVAAVLGVLGAILAPTMLRIMGASPDVLRIGTTYARVMLGGNVTIFMLYLINAIFRGAGDAAIAMRVLWFANAINIVLGPLLIFGIGPFPELGVTGAAVATNIGRGAGALFAFSRLLKPGSRIDIHVRHLRIDRELIARMANMAWSAATQLLIGMGSWIALVRILSTYGSTVIAGYTIGIRVVLFALLPAAGLANAAATMVGQALGAQKPERAETSVMIAGWYNCVVLSVVGALLAIFASAIARLFTQDAAIIPVATSALRLMALGFPFYGWGMVTSQALNGAGDTKTPTWLNLFVFWCWEIPLAWAAKALGFGTTGIFLSITIAFSTYAVAGWLVFRRGTWKAKRV
jgi:putative MATE family efflux protein